LKPKVYFPGLHGIRFLAALAVVVHHIEQLKGLAKTGFPLPPAQWHGLGLSGVGLFFVLSGFLITYLLLTENQELGRIDIAKFYGRRILRIWPLYYLIVLLAFFVVPHLTNFGGAPITTQPHFSMTLLLFLLILPHFAISLYPPVFGASQTWSIGVEEHFYIVWPLLVRLFIKRLMLLFAGLIVCKLLLLRGLPSLAYRGGLWGWDPALVTVLNVTHELVRVFQIEYMTIGAMAAYLFFGGTFKRATWLLNPVLQALNFLLLIWLIDHDDFRFYNIIQASVFALFIVHVVTNSKLWPVLDCKPLRYLGTISYGIYMFHPVIIALLVDKLTTIPAVKASSGLLNGLLYSLTIAATIGIAALSYAFFETPFLRMKKRLEMVKTTETEAP